MAINTPVRPISASAGTFATSIRTVLYDSGRCFLLLVLFSALVLSVPASADAQSAYAVPSAIATMAANGLAGGDVRINIAPVAKIMGDTSQVPAGVLRQNAGLGNVTGADLGYPALYHNQWYLAFGDTSYDSAKLGDFAFYPNIDAPANFVVATSSAGSLDSGMPFNGFLNMEQAYSTNAQAPFRAIDGHADQYTLPGGLYTVKYHGQETLVGQYMLEGNAGGYFHWAQRSTIAVFNPTDGQFHDWKPAVYAWQAPAGSQAQYDFGNSVFWEDAAETYLYMIGADANRFGGVKLARISVSSFLDPVSTTGWSYWLGSSWSDPKVSESATQSAVPWVISPHDPAWSPTKDYQSVPNQCADMGIAEFSVTWNPYLNRFLLLTGTSSCGPHDLQIYQAPALVGPWTPTPAVLDMPAMPAKEGHAGGLYAPYTTDAMQTNGGQTMYFLMSTYGSYGVYLFRATFNR
jgi:hypothetical protein